MRVGLLAVAVAALTLLSGCGGSSKTVIVVAPGVPNATGQASGQAGAVTPYRVPSGSMEPTLTIGEVVWIETAGYSPAVGNIVVFHPPEGAEQEMCGPVPHMVRLGGEACDQPIPQEASVKFIKRIVAGPGDTITIVEGHVIRNGARQADSYIRPCAATSAPECNFPKPIKIPAGDWFMLGDNRGESDDSRFWGPVPAAWFVGKARWCGSLGTACPTE